MAGGRWRGRDVDDKLWAEFRGLQDQFFDARSAVFNAEETEFRENLAAKQKLLEEAEAAMLPVTDVKVAKDAFREFLASYNQLGKVPRRPSVRSRDASARWSRRCARPRRRSGGARPEARKRASTPSRCSAPRSRS